MYANGPGVEKDAVQAATCFKQAAEQGDAVAQLMLGSFFCIGMGGVDTDFVQAEYWIRKAADAGLAEARYSMGQSLENSDQLQSMAWYLKAAWQGHLEAQQKFDAMFHRAD